MRKIWLIAFTAVFAIACAGNVWAWDRTDHVVQAPNGKGDLIIYPFYATTTDGHQTNFWVTNTSDTYSTVAKVVFRSYRYTQEILDFFIFLSPNDVFKATIKYDGGNVVVTSTDDSVIAQANGTTPVWANESPMVQTLSVPRCEQTTEIGYIEVFEVAYQNYPKVANKVEKGIILTGFGGIARLNVNNRTWVDPVYMTQEDPSPYNNAYANTPGMIVGTLNILAGHMELGIPNNSMTAMTRATVLRNYDTSLDYVANISEETFIGDVNAHNSTAEAEAALSKDQLHMPYSSSSQTVHFLTFPTKYTQLDNNCRVVNWFGPYFKAVLTPITDNCVNTDEYTAYDMMENSQRRGGLFSPYDDPGREFCWEVNFDYPADYPYSEGWVRHDFQSPDITATTQSTETINYNGVPVIGTVLDFGMGAGGMLSAAWDDTDVWFGGVNHYYYQYWDMAHYPGEEAENRGGFNYGFRTDNGNALPVEHGSWPSPAVIGPNTDYPMP